MSDNDNSSLWDSATTAAFLNVPVRTLDQWAYRHEGPRFYKIGRHRRYYPHEVRAWVDSVRSEPTGTGHTR